MYGLGVNRLGVTKTSEAFEWEPTNLFANGEQGAWYDPSDLSSMKQLSDGTVDAVVGQPVGYLRDKSGKGNHAIQATSAKRPVLRQDGSLYYLEFDGGEMCLVTGNIDFTGGDQMSVFSGVKKNDNAIKVIAELSNTIGSNNGSFRMNYGAAGLYRYTSKGTSVVNGSDSTYSAPSTNVLTGTSDISEDVLIMRIDGTEEAAPTSDQGTGNYGDYPLNIGARNNGNSLPLDGNIYGLVVRNVVSSAADITNTEAYLAAKTGVTL